MSNTTVAICAIVRDEAPYIEEWVEFHRRQGVTQFQIYDNGSVDGTPDIFRKLGIEPVIWAGRPHNFDPQQQAAYLDGANVLTERVDWVAFIDADEFLFGRAGQSLPLALSSMPSDSSAIAVQQCLFGSSGHQTKTPGRITSNFTKSAAPDFYSHAWFKTIARPGAIKWFDSVHSVKLLRGQYVLSDGSPLTREASHPGEASRIAEGAIRLHHYPLKSLEEFREKQARWADREAANRFVDSYFFDTDKLANAVVNTEAEDAYHLNEPSDRPHHFTYEQEDRERTVA